MVIEQKKREELIKLLERVNYRKIVSERVGCHPNTVTNILHTDTDNPRVEHELLRLAQEVKKQKHEEDTLRRKNRAIAKQL